MPFPPELTHVEANTTSDTFVTVLDVTGSGLIDQVLISCINDTGEIRITIDGYSETLSIAGNLQKAIRYNITPTTSDVFDLGAYGDVYRVRSWFQDNFKVEHRRVLGTTMNTKVTYGAL